MIILVTGGAGYIGSVVVERLIMQNHSVGVVDNLQEGHREAVEPAAVFYQSDFGDKRLLEKIFNKHNIDIVFHFAAETTIEYSMTDPSIYFENNVVKGIALLNTMLRFNCKRLIFSSTAATFGKPQYDYIDEEHPQSPINAYGESKLIFETILEWYNKAYDLSYNSFRYFNAAGASKRLGEDHRNESHLIPLVLRVALGKKEYIEIYGTNYDTKDGTCIRDYIHVKDIAEAHIKAINNLDKHPNRVYNLGNGEGYSVKDVIETARRVTGKDIPVKEVGRRPGDPATLVASYGRAKEELGWDPQYADLEDIIRTAWEWNTMHPSGYKKQ